MTETMGLDLGENMAVSQEQKAEHAAFGWLVTLTAALFFFYEFIQLNLFNAIDVQLMEAFHLNAPQLGQLSSMYFYANALCLFPAGILLDRFSTKKLLLGAVSLCTIGTFIFALAEQYAVAAFGRFLVGMGASFCFLSCIRLASRWFPPSKMALVTGLVVTMAMLGGLVAQTPMAILSGLLGWRHAVLIDASLGILVALAILLIVQDRPPNSEHVAHADRTHLQTLGFWQSIKLVLLNRNNWLGGIYTSLMNLPVFLLGALWGIHYLTEVHHVSHIQASYATTLFFVGVIFGSPAFGWFSDRIGRRVLPMVIGAIISLGVILVLMYLPNLTLNALMGLFFLIGFVTSSQVLSYPAIAELNPSSLTSTAVSVDSVTIMVSGAIFQPFFGWIMESGNTHAVTAGGAPIYSAGDFMNAMMIMPIAFILSIFIGWMIKESFCRSQA
ncbi:MAG TPA: MFS transporter [Gammaproteobacteria bacterium]|nr:MFS transporter [Gammaproteobacteria bacterium]